MSGVNKVILVGNLGKDPEVRFTGSSTAVANFNIATNEQWTDHNGQKQERTEWHRIVVWGKQAECCGEYLTKGRQVYIEGRLQTREWTDKENRKNYTTEVVATHVVFLAGGERPAPSSSVGSRSSGAPRSPVNGPSTFPNYGRSKGAPIAGASAEDLEFYANNARKSLADPSRSKWHDQERALLTTIEAEQARQGGGRGGPVDEPPPPDDDDDDIPF